MASRILGIDLGAYSVKVAVATPGFRSAGVTDLIERQVPAGDEPAQVRAARVLAEILRENQLGEQSPFCAVPGDQVFIHLLEFSFKNIKRQQLEQVVGAELEGVLPLDLEDIVYCHEKLPDSVGRIAASAAEANTLEFGDEDPTHVQALPQSEVVHGRVAPPTAGMRVLACAMPRKRARKLLDNLDEHGAEMHGLIAAPTSYARIAGRIGGLVADKSSAPVAIIDMGHARTDLCVIQDGRAIFARTIARGGRDITQAIARTWRLDEGAAQEAKHSDGFVASAAIPASSDAWRRIHEVVITELAPLGRDLRQSLSACLAKTGAIVSRAALVGGGSRMRGIAEFLSEKLCIPVATLTAEDNQRILGAQLGSTGVLADVACLATGVAFEGASGRPTFDLRRGDLAYKADMSFLRVKATQLAAAVIAVVAFASINAYAKLDKLKSAEQRLDQRLVIESTAIHGSPKSADEVIGVAGNDVAGAPGANDDSPLPKMTAYDILLDISHRLPASKEVKVDVTDIEIKPGRITMKATTGSTETNDAVKGSAELIKKLKTQDCFESVDRGNISSAANDTKNFPVTIKSNCM
jgi:general secretion pathway protein L